MSTPLTSDERKLMDRLGPAEVQHMGVALRDRYDMSQGPFAYYNQPVFGEYNHNKHWFGYCRTCHLCSVEDHTGANNSLRARLCDSQTGRCAVQTGSCDDYGVAFDGPSCSSNRDCDYFHLPHFLCAYNNGFIPSNDNQDMCLPRAGGSCDQTGAVGNICKCPHVRLHADGTNANAEACTLKTQYGLSRTFCPPGATC